MEALDKLQKKNFSPSPLRERAGERARQINVLTHPLSLALSPFQGERGLVQSFPS
jgi:hypothetical protein